MDRQTMASMMMGTKNSTIEEKKCNIAKNVAQARKVSGFTGGGLDLSARNKKR